MPHGKIYENVTETVGGTPLIYLNRQENWTLALGIRAFNDSYVARWELIFAASTVMLAPMVASWI